MRAGEIGRVDVRRVAAGPWPVKRPLGMARGVRRRTAPLWLVLALACVALIAAPPAAAQRAPDPARPHAAERTWVEACILVAQAHPPRAAFGRCAWRIVATCQGEPGEGLLIARLPPLPDRPQPARICMLVETAIWQQQLDRWQRELGLLAGGAAAEALRRAQRAFLGYRDVACQAEEALSAAAEAEANRLSCRLEQTALRALELKRLRDEMVLAIAAASVEGP